MHEKVIELTTEDFEHFVYDPYTYQLIDRRQSWLIKFYNMSCVPCQKFVPVWNVFIESYQHMLHIGQVDCSNPDNHEVCLQFSVDAFPTIMYFRDDKYHRLAGSRALDKLEDFVFKLGYLSSTDQGPIPHKLANFKKKVSYQNMTDIRKAHKYVQEPLKQKSFVQRLAAAVDHLVEDHWTSLRILPYWLRYILALVVVSSPLWCIAACKCIDHLSHKFRKHADRTSKVRQYQKMKMLEERRNRKSGINK